MVIVSQRSYITAFTAGRGLRALLLTLLLLGLWRPVVAQDEPDAWTGPVNLSRSGAASLPVIAIAPDGVRQAFWWDTFDGLTTSAFDPEAEAWTAPQPAAIIIRTVTGEGENVEVTTAPIAAMPHITPDGAGLVHAFWLGAPSEETGLRSLQHSRLRLGTGPTLAWTDPQDLAESVTVWSVARAPGAGTLHLLYVRPTQSDTWPAGLYAKRSTDEGATWSAPVVVLPSVYFRLYTAEQLDLSVVAGTGDTVTVAWDDPRLGRPFLVRSTDGGATWSDPVAVEAPDLGPAQPRLFATGDPAQTTYLLWQATRAFGGCELYQQAVLTETLSAPVRVLADLRTCPEQAALYPTGDGALLVAGQGTGSLTLAAWDSAAVDPASGEPGVWSVPQALGFSFDDAETGARVSLGGLQTALAPDDTLVVVGLGTPGQSQEAQAAELWALAGQTAAAAFAFAPPPPWAAPTTVATQVAAATDPAPPATAVDAEGRLHLLWAEPGEGLRYTQWTPAARAAGTSAGAWRAPAAVLPADAASDPALLAHGDQLHAVWVAGTMGAVLYSRAYTRDAYAASGWSSPVQLSPAGAAGSAPAILADAAGALHVVFAVPLNEGRGIAYTRSGDGGDTWSDPVPVFDAGPGEEAGATADRGASAVHGATAGRGATADRGATAVHGAWAMVDHPALAADAAGTLHVAWTRGSVAGPFPLQSLHYARSTDGGQSWTAPALLAEGATAWPHLAATGATLHALWLDADRGTLNARVSTDGGTTWGYQQGIPGLQSVAGPAAVAGGGETLVLLAQSRSFAGDRTLQALTWAEGRWAPLEDPLALDAAVLPGVAAALAAPQGRLHAFLWAAGDDPAAPPALRHTARDLTAAPSGEAAAPVPGLPTPTPQPSPTPLPTATPYPTIDASAPPRSAPAIQAGPLTLPLAALAGTGAAVVLVLLIVLIASRRKG